MKSILTIVIALFSLSLSAQQTGTIKGLVTDSISGEVLIGITWMLYQGDTYLGKSGATDIDGRYHISNVKPGDYIISFNDMTHPVKKFGINVRSEKVAFLDVTLSEDIQVLGDGVVIVIHEKLINPDSPTETFIKADDIEKLVVRYVTDIAPIITPGVKKDEATGALYIRGSRDGSVMYVIDGIKTYDPVKIPRAAIEEMRVLTSGVPAEFGDLTGGVIYITTKSGLY